MTIRPGTRFGPYEVVALIGAGGMGEVYQATDTRLGRTVAIKVLPAVLASDPEFKARFEREARSISALNHPHICTLHDVGEATTGGTSVSYLVMEHLEGETLSARLLKGPLPLELTLAYACQIADALEKAHRQGIVHRDLKPANIFLTRGSGPSGPAICKLLDFGLAKLGMPLTPASLETKLASRPAPTSVAGGGPEVTPLTAQGTILGTFQYMAPEQIEGLEADARSDIWAFGCVLYEMLTGRRAFQGRSQASLIASILEREPAPLAELQPMTPPGLDRLVRTCLAKNPDDRFHTTHDLRLHLQWIREGGSAAGLPAPVASSRRRRDLFAAGGVALVLAGLAFAAGWWIKPALPVGRVVTRFSLPLPEGQAFTRRGRHMVAVSPDGTKVAYVANQQIYLRELHQLEPQPIRGTQLDPAELVFSPDGESIAFVTPTEVGGLLANAVLKRIRISGGTAVTVCALGPPFGIRWQGDRIVFSTGTEIKVVADTGGEPETLLSVAAESGERLAHPQLLQNGKALLYTVRARNASFNDSEIAVQPLGGTRRVLVAGGMDGRAMAQGILLYARDNTVFGQPFDASTLQVAGGPVPLFEAVSVAEVSGAAQFSISDTGTLAYVPGSGSGLGELVWIDRKGNEQALAAPAKNYGHPRVSPDAGRIVTDTLQGEDDIWIWDDVRQTLGRLTSGASRDVMPVWSHDGRSIIYRSENEGQVDLYRRTADGTGTAERLTNTREAEAVIALLPDTKRLLVRIAPGRGAGAGVLSTVTLGEGSEAQPVIPTAAPSQIVGEVSPDGRWLAYEAREGGSRGEIYVRPFPNSDSGRWQISVAGGTRPVWSRTGRELFFVTDRPAAKMMAVTVQPTAPREPFISSAPSIVFDVSDRIKLGTGRGFDVTPDGTRFLMIRGEAAEFSTQGSITIVTSWLDELNAQLKRR